MGIPRWGPLKYLAEAPEEVWFFFRLGGYAFFIGTVYWFVSYEPAGTILLFGFGIGGMFGTLIFGAGARRVRLETEAEQEAMAAGVKPEPLSPNGPFGDERGRIPSPSYAPFAIGLGSATMGLGLVFGPWLIGIGLLVVLVGATEWLSAVAQESRSMGRPGETRDSA